MEIARDRFDFMRPERVGYLPGPLVSRCDTCEKIKEYISTAHHVADPLTHRCTSEGGGHHESRWRQLDVVTCIGREASKVFRPIDTRPIALVRFERSRGVSVDPKSFG